MRLLALPLTYTKGDEEQARLRVWSRDDDRRETGAEIDTDTAVNVEGDVGSAEASSDE